MKLKTQSFALALGQTAAIAYTLCALVVSLFPGLALTLVSWVFHMTNLGEISISWGSYIGGLIQITVYTYLFGLVLTGLYNRSVRG